MTNAWIPALTNDRVSAVIVRDGKLLCIHRFRGGKEYWVLPGGGMEDGETQEVALRREVWEETGLGMRHAELLFDIENAGRIEHHWRVALEPGEPHLGGPEAERASADNRYIFVWLSPAEARTVQGFYPSSALDVLLSMWEKDEL